MLQLTEEQRLHLYDFVLCRCEQRPPLVAHLEHTLGYIMSNVDVRKLEQIQDEPVRELVRCTFELLKNDYMLDNSLITTSKHQDTISEAQARVKNCLPGLGN